MLRPTLLWLNLIQVNTEVITMKKFFCYIRRLEGENFGCSWPQKGEEGIGLIISQQKLESFIKRCEGGLMWVIKLHKQTLCSHTESTSDLLLLIHWGKKGEVVVKHNKFIIWICFHCYIAFTLWFTLTYFRCLEVNLYFLFVVPWLLSFNSFTLVCFPKQAGRRRKGSYKVDAGGRTRVRSWTSFRGMAGSSRQKRK